MRCMFRCHTMQTIVFDEVYEVDPTHNGWSIIERLKIADIEYDDQETRFIGSHMEPVFDISYDLVENRYYLIKNRSKEEHYYHFKDGELNPIAWADVRDDKNNELEKENDRLRAKLDEIYLELKIKKEDKNA